MTSSRNGGWKFQEVSDEQMVQPADWGGDSLTEFLQAAQKNTYLMINAHKAGVKRLRAGIELFAAGADAYFSVRRVHSANDERFVVFDITFAFLMASAQALYAATTLAFSGQQNEAAKPLRGALETALYAYHFHRVPEALDVWASRPLATTLRNPKGAEEAKKRRSKAGAEFSATRILKELNTEDPKLAKIAGDLYEQMIDEGGHFNIPVFHAQTRFTRFHDPDRRRVDYRLIGSTDKERREALKTLTVVTSSVLRIFQIQYREFWEPAGVSGRVLVFTRGT